MWEYQAALDTTRTGVVDGDTFDLRVDLGFYTDRRVRVRLAGIDTAEIYGVSHDSDEYAAGSAHAEFAASWLTEAARSHPGSWPLRVRTAPPRGKYGRWIAVVERKSDDESLNDALVGAFPTVLDDD